MRVVPLETRLWQRVDKQDDGCWVWTGGCNQDGYGSIQDRRTNKTWSAHRLAYTLLVGEIPKGLTLDHLCRNRRCVNPDHLDPVTHRENVLRGESPSAKHAKKTHCPQGHPYSGDNLYLTPDNRRICRECQRASHRRSKAKLKSLKAAA